MSPITVDNKRVAQAVAAAFGVRPKVHRYWDNDHRSFVDIASCANSPCEGVTSYATIGLSDTPLVRDGEDVGLRTEIVGACDSRLELFGNVLSSAAFCVINSGWFVAPGVIFPGVISMYDASKTMEHCLFLPPFLWGGRLQTLELSEKKVAWLLVVPISENEMRFAESKGVPALEDVFEEHRIDIFNLARPSTVEDD